MNTLPKCGRRWICELGLLEDGMAGTEYAVVIALLVVAVLATLLLFGDSLVSTFNYFANQFADGSSSGGNLADPLAMAYANSSAR